ncbi:MAG: peroxidase-related enzyme [Pirellulales bacterium]|nr:peroxidase-related enzyme [Pirellulales bacterium]
MAWIKTISPDDATGPLAETYRQVAGRDGHVDHILQSHSMRPRTLDAHLALYKAVLHSRPNDLSPRERELVGVCVSRLNGCEYCVVHHTAGLARHLKDTALAEQLAAAAVADKPREPLSPKEWALCRYARRLTESPAEMCENDIAELRAAGLSDEAILDLNQIVAYFAYANRTVLGLGVSHTGEPLGLHPDENRTDFRHS